MPTYEVDNTFNKSMFSQIIVGSFTENSVWKSWGDTTIATYQGNPFGNANGTSSTRAYPWELDPASPSTSSPWHNIIYENCIGQYNWGARAFLLFFPFGGLNSSIFITPEILKRTHTVANPSVNNHDQPAIWKGFKYAIKALLEGTLAPVGKTAMTEPCNVMLYLTANRGDSPYVSRSTTFWSSLPGSSNDKDAKYYEYLDAMVDDIISMKSVSGGRLHIALDTAATSATPSSVAAFRARFYYRTDALELSDWYVFNRLVEAGIPTFYEARTRTTITENNLTLPVDWAGKAHFSGEYWNILSNPTHPYVDSNASQYVTDEDSEMTFRFLDPNFPPFPAKDPYGSIHEVVYEGKTRVFLNESMIGGTSYFTPHNAMFSYYMLSDHYRKYYNINTSTSTFSGVYLETPNIIGYDYTFISSGYQCLAVYIGPGTDPKMNYWNLPATIVNYRPPFEPGTGPGQWNGPGGHLAYNKGLWTQDGKDAWDAGVRGSSFADFISKLHDYSLIVGPKYNWFGVKYGSLADTLTRNVIDLVSPSRVFTDFWASSWFSTDPLVTSMTIEPANIGNVNSYSFIKPMIHVHDCVGDGGYNNADGTPIVNSLSNFLNASSGCGNRIDAIKTKLMEIPAEKRVLKMTRYDQGHYYKNTYDAYDGPNLWAENLGAFLRDDWTTIATALKNAGCAPDYITMDCPPGESNIFFVFSSLLDTALITNIISDPNASLPWYGIKSFNNIYTNDGQYPLVFNEIYAEIRHAQYHRQYIWWEKAVSAVQTELLNEFIVKPTREIFGISKVSNYDSTIVSEDTNITNFNGHPYFGENIVGDANSPVLYAAWAGGASHSILNSDTTRIVRNDYGEANGGTTAFPATAWNQFLNLMQIMRGVKRKSPNKPIRPWISSIDWVGSGQYNPQWNTDSNSKSLYWESIRHFVMTGSDMIHYWNHGDDTPYKLVKNCSKLNNLLEDINKRIGGYTLHQTNIARIDYLANYVISGVPVNNTYVWRVTPKPDVTLITSGGENLALDIDRGAWITTTTSNPPFFT